MDPEIQAGPPAGVPPLALADFVAANPHLGPTLIADWLAQRQVDEPERQVLRWASQVAARIERRTAENFVYGSLGVWHGHHSHRTVVMDTAVLRHHRQQTTVVNGQHSQGPLRSSFNLVDLSLGLVASPGDTALQDFLWSCSIHLFVVRCTDV